jgi:hypothetical protein
MKQAILITIFALLATNSYAKDNSESVGICAGHYYMLMQYDKVEEIIKRANDVAKMKQAANAWIETILRDAENGTDVASIQARKACVVDLKIKSFPN